MLLDKKRLFVLVPETEWIRPAINKKCTSLSSAIGTEDKMQKPIASLISTIKGEDSSWNANYFPFENRLGVDLSRLQEKKVIPIVRMIPDRICWGKKIFSDGVEVSCESWRHIVAMELDEDKFVAKFLRQVEHQNNVFLTSEQKVYSLLHNKKRYLFNGVHKAITCMAYQHLRKCGIEKEDMKIQFLNITLPEILKNFSHILRGYIDAQIARLILLISDPEIATEAFGCDDADEIYVKLKGYSNSVLARVMAVPDRVGRVYQLDTKKSEQDFNEHFVELAKFLERNKLKISRLKIQGLSSMNDMQNAAHWFESSLLTETRHLMVSKKI
jgi:hypothetical protein